jgi:hypothetical protein
MQSIKFDLTGYEEWLRIGRLSRTSTSEATIFEHKGEPDLHYQSAAEVITLARRLTTNQEGAFGSRGTQIREQAELHFTPSEALTTASVADTFIAVQDLLILLTGSEYQMPVPSVMLASGKRASLYFQRAKSTETPPRYYECPVHFFDIKQVLGDLLFSWLNARRDLGAAAYLYLATRRGLDIYEEHKFLNLMTGLEAFHRARLGDGDTSAYKAKLARIAAQVDDPSDRSWLTKRLKNLGRPNLEERLLALLGSVPMPVEGNAMRDFLGTCARARNEIAHTGHSQEASASDAPLQWLAVRSTILSHLYHAKLLLEIGVPEALVKQWLTTGHGHHNLAWYLHEAGLAVVVPESQAPVLP